MAHLNYHPAPGFGDLIPGSYAVPQNPILDAATELVPSPMGKYPNQVLRVKGIGEILNAQWTVPQNPIIAALANGVGVQPTGAGMGCVGCTGMNGLGDTTTDFLTADMFGIGVPNWAILGGTALVAWMLFMPGGRDYRRQKRELASKHTGIARFKKTVRSAAS